MMNKFIVLVAAILVVGSGCGKVERVEDFSVTRSDACVPVGNQVRLTFCALTYSQLLSHPGAFSERKIFVHAWAIRGGDDIFLYPSIDSYESGEVYDSLKVEGGEAYRDFFEYMSRRPELEPVRVKIGGNFVFNEGRGTNGSVIKGRDFLIFGRIELDEFRM